MPKANLITYAKTNPATVYGNGAAVTLGIPFTWVAGDVIVAASTHDTSSASSFAIDNETNLTFTATGPGAGGTTACWSRSWYAVATGSGSGTISGVFSTPGGSSPVALHAWHYRDSAGIGNVVGAAFTGATPTQALTASLDSTVISLFGDYNGAAGDSIPVTATGTMTEREDTVVTGFYGVWAAEWSEVSAGANNWGITVGTGKSFTFAGTIEVLGTISTVPAAPTIPAGGYGGTNATYVPITPGANGYSPITDYTVDYALASAPTTWLGPFSDGAAQSSPFRFITGLTVGTAYVFRAKATNAIGDSAWSGTSAPITPLASTGARRTMPGDQVLTMPGDFLMLMAGLAAGGLPAFKVWNGSAWVTKPIKWWNGSAWVAKTLKST